MQNLQTMTRLLVFLLLLLPASAWGWSGVVSYIPDGDTIHVTLNNATTIKVRLYGIDCPESAQPGGFEATQFVRAKAYNAVVEGETVDVDRYGRQVALVSIDGKNLNGEIVEAGYAWVYTRYCTMAVCKKFDASEAAARVAGRGLWAEPDPTPPWEWRKRNK